MGKGEMISGHRLTFPAVNEVLVMPFELPAGAEPGNLLVKTEISVISAGTEIRMLTTDADEWPGRGWPRHPGYSHIGTVVDVGDRVEGWAPGDRVYSQARHQSHVQIRAAAAAVSPIPAGVSAETASFTTLFAIALYAVRRAEIAFGESVFILGAGIVGQLALRVVRRTGAHPVIVGDLLAARLAGLTEQGADAVVDLQGSSPADALSHSRQGEGFDVVIDATGSAAAFPTSLKLVRRRGRVALLGSPHGPVTVDDLFHHLDGRDITVLGCQQPNNPRRGNLAYPWGQDRERQLILELMAAGKLDVDEIPVGRVTPGEAPDAYHRLRQRQGPALTYLIDWQGEGT